MTADDGRSGERIEAQNHERRHNAERYHVTAKKTGQLEQCYLGDSLTTFKELAMRSFRIVFIWDGCEYAKLFQAASAAAVLTLVARQYPGSHVWSVEEI
jgi:hypothetical protein